MPDRHLPNQLEKAAASSALPRAMRARVGATTDPVPEGKLPASHPHHHFTIKPASHDVDRAQAKTAEELGLEHHEAAKLQRTGRDHLSLKSPAQMGMSFSRTDTQANKDF